MKFYSASTASGESDEILLSAYRKGEDLAILGNLYQRHTDMVYYVCFRYFKDAERSKDAVMQIFEELTTKVKRQEIRNFSKWLYVVTKNHCLMALRGSKKNKEVAIDNFVEFALPLHPEEGYEQKEERLLQLERCVETLSDKQKKSIDLFFFKEKCYKEVAELTGYSLLEVKSYIQNGKRNLKNCIEKSDE